ncbi:MAG TPA: DUF4166 domain-containing protein [Xanthomonadales bacterium]|nr:DUF4166 domain-containing protein [Xanthomonadales bacterium]
MATNVFRDLLGVRYDALPAAVRALHEAAGRELAGDIHVVRGTGPLAALAGRIAGLPPAFRGPFRFESIPGDGTETWCRRVGRHEMRSTLRGIDGLLVEDMGLIRFRFALEPDDSGLNWRLAHVRWLGIPLPVSWFAGVHAREFQHEDGRYGFSVEAALPLLGRIVRYDGALEATK